ncbi:MAG: ATP-binding cassette domain-containing protein, partial [Chloroflexi bacterium]|nr:ATP-binding cassette domain-containing protein [Chloroflexota bacterium]
MRLEVKRLVGPPRLQPRLEDVSLIVENGQIGAVFGPERSGKRGLLRVLSGLEQHASGDIFLNESSVQHLAAPHRRVAAVFQDTPMFPGTVAENVRYGLERIQWPPGDRERRVAEVLELGGMTGSEGDRATTLPDAERWRIALARAIAPAPPVLLIESPTWPVDEVSRPDYRAALRQLLKSINLTTLIATADLRDAVSIADDLHVMDDGRILQSGALSRVLAGPASITVAEMVGYHTLIRGEVTGNWILEPGVGAVQFPAGFPLNGNARALAHPAAMLGVPETSGLGIGVTGLV